MPRRSPPLALALPPRQPGQPAGRWLYAALRAAILEGRVRAGMRLPASRDLARQHGLSRGTVVDAFAVLQSEGYLEAGVGSGTFVARMLPDRWFDATPAPRRPRRPLRTSAPPTTPPLTPGSPASPTPPGVPPPPAAASRPRRLSELARRVQPFPSLTPGPPRAFRTDLPALDLFPTALWAQVAGRRLRRASADLLRGCGPLGYRPLQEAVAGYLSSSRGVCCVPEQVAVVSGVQEALDLATRLLIDPGDRVAIEDPGYPGASLVFAAAGADLVAVPVDGAGLTLDGPLLDGVRLVYVTPAHQFPLGVCMSLPRRLALLEWARSSGAFIFEDDYDSEFRYSGPPMPALQGLDRHGQVLFAGSFSKVLFPSLRLGYLVVPDGLVDCLAAARSLATRHAPLPDQAVLADFITLGHFGRHLRRMRQVYAGRLAALLEHAAARLAGLLEISPVAAGLQTAARLCHGIDGRTAAAAALRRDVEVTPISRYAIGPVPSLPPVRQLAEDGLQLGFAPIDEHEIARGVRALAAALEGEIAARGGGG
jgi:GntR family transcriptional regulator/MocR family aminotransferase